MISPPHTKTGTKRHSRLLNLLSMTTFHRTNSHLTLTSSLPLLLLKNKLLRLGTGWPIFSYKCGEVTLMK